VITRGSVNVQVPENGLPKTINSLHKNDYFGEMSLLTGAPRSATVVAAEETEVLRIDKIALKPLFESNPELVRSISEMVVERKVLLDSMTENAMESEERAEKGMLRSIKNFFGLK